MRALTVAVVGVLLFAGCGSDSDSDSESAGDEASLLFVQDADGGNLDDDQLTMIEVSPNTGWFTDRPVREAGQMATADFVSLWDEGATFDIDRPNADFTCQAGGDTVNVVVELSSPVVNGRTLSYDVVQVGDTPTGDFDCDGNAHLFIDSASDACARAKAGSLSLQSTNLGECDLTDANLTDANLVRANLTDANLTRANLTDANLKDANLTDAYMPGANLTDANLFDSNMARVTLSDANLTDANLNYADLNAADLNGANLTDANLTDAILTDANLKDANLTDANLNKANLRGVIGWDSVKGKNTIGGLDKATGVPD